MSPGGHGMAHGASHGVTFPRLWEYQTRAVDAVRRAFPTCHRRPPSILLAMPTAAGKTVTGCAIVASAIAHKGRRVLWLTHRIELIRQTSAQLVALGVPHGVILAGEEPRPELPMQVASVQTLDRRGETPDGIDIVILDEAHHATAGTWRAILRAYPSLELVLGLTATPQRGDGAPLGDVFETLVPACSVAELVRLNAADARVGLVPCDVIAPAAAQRELAADPVDAYLSRTPGKRAIVFCASVGHAHELAAAFRARGVAAECVEGETRADVRAGALRRLASGETKVVTNVFCLTEGTDVREVETVVIARGCTAWAAWMQMIGRGRRTSVATGKTRCTVLDLRGHVHVHGLPDDDVAFSLEGRAVQPDARPVALRQCRSCGAVYRPAMSLRACPRCLVAVPPPEPPKVRTRDMSRVSMVSVASHGEKRRVFDELVAEARAKGWRPKAVGMRFRSRFGHWPSWPLPSGGAA
jgi:DNA repair protein RadD